MARPRTITDEHLLSCATAVLGEVGPARFTLSGAAARAGVSPATYIKRFGTKQGLFLALNRQWVDGIAPGIAAAVTARTGVDRVRSAALWGVADMDRADHAANMLATLALDLQHPQMTALLDQGWAIWHGCVADYVAAAVEAGHLPGAPPPTVAAQMLFAIVEGTRIAWCVRPEGSMVQRVGDLIDALLASWGSRQEGTD